MVWEDGEVLTLTSYPMVAGLRVISKFSRKSTCIFTGKERSMK